MDKDICCVNFKSLLEYVIKHFGEEGAQRLTEGLTGNPEFLITDRKNPLVQIPIEREHLMDSSCWVSNEFSLRLLANVKRVVPGPTPLFTAGVETTLEKFSRHILFLARLLGPQRLSSRAAKLNAHFNKTKTVSLLEATKNSALFRLDYFPGFRVTRDVCEWNRGIYAGISQVAGAREVQVRETTCVVDGAPHCTLEISWKRVSRLKQIQQWLLKTGLEDLVADYEQALRDRETLINHLAESEGRYRSLTDHSLTGIFIFQKDHLVYVNERLTRITGFTARELMEKTLAELIPAEYLGPANTLIDQIQQAVKPHSRQEFQVRRKDGAPLWLEVLLSAISFQGAPALMGNVIDITARKRAEDEKRLLEERLSRSEKMEALGLLAGGVAHDLNNILSGIVSYPELLLLDLPKNSPLRNPLVTIQESGLKSAAIVQDLLTLARRGVTHTEVLNLNRIIENYLQSPEQAKLKTYHPQVRIMTDLESDLPWMEGSPVHLKKTVMNLISNAAEAQPQGGLVEIGTESRFLDRPVRGFETIPAGEYVVLKVGDQGTGIPAEDLNRIFEPFFTKKVMGRSGTGLGMAVVWGTVRDHQGYIHVNSRIDQGTLFEIFFPVTRKTPPGESSPLTLDTLVGHGERVLVVDDLPEQRTIAGSMLARLGYQGFAVSSGEEALRFIEEQPVDLVLLDMLLGSGLDGLETYQKIIEIFPGQKAVIASGFSETDRVAEARRLGAGGYLKKPYTLQKLGLAVKAELARP